MCLGVHPQPLLNQDPVSACCFVSSGDLWMVGHPFLLSCFKHFFKLSLLSRLKKKMFQFFFSYNAVLFRQNFWLLQNLCIQVRAIPFLYQKEIPSAIV